MSCLGQTACAHAPNSSVARWRFFSHQSFCSSGEEEVEPPPRTVLRLRATTTSTHTQTLFEGARRAPVAILACWPEDGARRPNPTGREKGQHPLLPRQRGEAGGRAHQVCDGDERLGRRPPDPWRRGRLGRRPPDPWRRGRLGSIGGQRRWGETLEVGRVRAPVGWWASAHRRCRRWFRGWRHRRQEAGVEGQEVVGCGAARAG